MYQPARGKFEVEDPAVTADLDARRRLARYCLLLALGVAVLSSYAYFMAFGWNVEAAIFVDPTAILDGGATAAALLRWGAFGDMFYSYLLLAPLALFLHARLRPIKPWLADLGSAGALAYIAVGGAAAAILGSVGPSLIEAYAVAPGEARLSIETSFGVLRNLVVFGVWQTLDPITAGTWILSVGLLIRPERPRVGRLLLLAGIGLMAMSGMTMLGIHSLALVLIDAAIVLLAWIGWMFIDWLAGRS